MDGFFRHHSHLHTRAVGCCTRSDRTPLSAQKQGGDNHSTITTTNNTDEAFLYLGIECPRTSQNFVMIRKAAKGFEESRKEEITNNDQANYKTMMPRVSSLANPMLRRALLLCPDSPKLKENHIVVV